MENMKARTYKTIDGVTYFKLRSDFEGDYTKNCGLLGEEIDKNFYFLRGYDIKDIYMTKDRHIVIERVDSEYPPFDIDISVLLEDVEEAGKDMFFFDKETGTIIVTYPDGTTAKMDGFLVDGKDIKMATEGSFEGDGTYYNPLKISSVYETGTYAPADEYFDITKTHKMPEGKGKGYRIVTKEYIDGFGCLYPFSAVGKIQSALTAMGSQWRVPTKSDWDELLNAMEVNPEKREHNTNKTTWLGEVAGSALKTTTLWDDFKTLPGEIPVEGQDCVGFSILPLGIGPDRNEILNDVNDDIEGFRKLGGVWTNTLDDTGNAYVKIFGYNSAKVDQDTYGAGARLSIRLLKDYSYNNYSEIETILGLPYPTVLVTGNCDGVSYNKIWTQINVYNSDPGLGGTRSVEWDEVTEANRSIQIIYFINEWDGTEWKKKKMEDGDSVVIINYDEKPYHEWRVINGELIDTIDDTMKDFNNKITNIIEKLDNEIKNRENSDDKLLEAIQNEGKIRLDVDNQLYSAITSESQMRTNVDKQLSDAIKQEGSIRKTQDDLLRTSIINESELRKSQDDKLLEAINKEIEVRTNVDEQLREAIKSEADIRKNVDGQLLEAIRNEGSIRKNNDIQPGEYILDGDNNMILPTFGANVEDVKIKVSSDFFNFGPILNNE